jgi:carboxypeptidase Taq
VLQDVHWSAALFGYFPTYALGNVLSLQFYQRILRDIPDLAEQIAQGEFGTLLSWLRKHIHQHGAKFTPQELVQRVTGEAINPQPFMEYVQAKYGELYGVAV